MVLLHYAQGFFPWGEFKDRTLWWSPEPRCVFQPNQIRVNRSLTKVLRRNRYEVRADTAFEEVIRACATTRPETWISERMILTMIELHRLGHAHSIETWERSPHGDRLVGGFYGVAVGRIFFGESMFSLEPNGSKIALVKAGQVLGKLGFPFIDCQLGSSHLIRMGAEFVPRSIFTVRVTQSIQGPRFIGPWTTFFKE